MQAGQPWFTGISKANLTTGAVEATWAPANHFPCEPIFVPRPGGTAEDDGVILSIVLCGADDKGSKALGSTPVMLCEESLLCMGVNHHGC